MTFPAIVDERNTEIERLRREKAELVLTLRKLQFWCEGIRSGRGNFHADDHIDLIQDALQLAGENTILPAASDTEQG